MARKRKTDEVVETVVEETIEEVQEAKPKPRRKKKETIEEEIVVPEVNLFTMETEVIEEQPKLKRKKKQEKIEEVVPSIVSEVPVVEEVLSTVVIEEQPKPKRKKKQEKVEEVVPSIVEETKVVEETPTPEVIEEVKPVIKRKKLGAEQVVEEAIRLNNLPVYDENNQLQEQLKVEEKAPKKPQKSKKQLRRERKEHELRVEQKILEGDDAAYVQIVKEKRRRRKIIRYNTKPQTGLTSEIVEHRQLQNLCNTKSTGSTKTVTRIIFSNIFTFFNLLNYAIAAWIIYSFKWEAWNKIFFVGIVTANIIISIVQEIRSKKIIDKLSILSQANSLVIRDGIEFEVPVYDVVLDDVICLSSGNQIPSDSIVLEGSIEVNESLLTGESDAIIKKAGDILYAGSFVVSGHCKARVERVGKDNYIEKLTSQAKKYRKPKSDLLKTLTSIIRFVGILIIPLGALVFMSQYEGVSGWLGFMGTNDYIESVQTTSGAVIGMIPSGLFLLTSIALAVGVIRLAQNNTLVQELYCIEMLARVDVLCLDKTGTITDGTMAVKDVIEYNTKTGLSVKSIYQAMQNVLNDDNVTSKALEERFGSGKKIKHKNFIPFSSARKLSAVEFEKYGTFVLGAPEFVLAKNYYLVADDVKKAASEGLRVICLGHTTSSIVMDKVPSGVTPVALILIEDTIRPDAIETIDYFKRSSVEVKVISGDNPLTVSKISERAGIDNADQYISLDGLSDKEVISAASKYTVFGRVSPQQKKLLVTTLKQLGKTVAMTGDGVNDILALREADCSISLGSGSDAARNVSHLVLLDSNFSSMPKVVAEGRRVINNVQRVASLFLTKTIFSLLLALYCVLSTQHKYPIATQHLIIIDVCVTGIPSFILALESNNSKVSGKFFVNVIKNALPGALAIALTTAIVFFVERLGVALNAAEMQTIIVLNATFTCFTVLFKVCRPFNVLRRILFFLMVTLAVSLVLFLPNVFEITQILPFRLSYLPSSYYENRMGIEAFLFMLCLMQATYPIIRFLSSFKENMKKLLNYIAGLLRKAR